ncbi:MAG: matrixin family metalloprotease [bacterium]|nr:matrixin family metalloprotease [bacterium]
MQTSYVTNQIRARSRFATLLLVLMLLVSGTRCSGGSGDCVQGLCVIGQDVDLAALLLTSALYAERIGMVSDALNTWNVGSLEVRTEANAVDNHRISFSSCAESPEACALALALHMKGACVTERADGLIQRSQIVIPLEFFAELANEPYEVRRKVVVHEIGHCLGMDHASHVNHVMAPSLYGALEPSFEERDAVHSVYEMQSPSPLITERIPGDPIFTLVLPSGSSPIL